LKNTQVINKELGMNIKSAIAISLILGIISTPVSAQQDGSQLEVLQNLIKQLSQNGLLSKDAAEKLILEAQQAAAKSAELAAPVAQSGVAAVPEVAPAAEAVLPGVVRVPFIPESVKNEMKETIKQEVLAQARGERWGDPGALPSWLGRISWDGDFRLRYQHDGFPAGNVTPAAYNPTGLALISNTTETHDYMRVQARLGMKAKVSDVTYTAFRISSGTTTNAVSTNQTLGTGFNKSSLVLDRAFVHSDPYAWLSINGGKIANPWLSTDLVWDSDVNFEGVSAQFKPRINDVWGSFVTLGAFPYQDVQRSSTVTSNSKWMFGAQLGGSWTAPDASNAQFGLALYQFRNVEGQANPTLGSHFLDQTAAQGMQKGNNLMYVNAVGDPLLYGLASRFKEVNLTAKMDWAAFDPVHVVLTGDYVRNLGFNQQEILNRTGLSVQPRVNGYQTMLTVGTPKIKQRGEWQANVAYKYLERDAVLDALTDSDFHLGGTNAKGFVIGGSYGVDDNAWVNLRWISTNQIDGAPLAIDTLQLDLNTRF
jgi:hypothetical protein